MYRCQMILAGENPAVVGDERRNDTGEQQYAYLFCRADRKASWCRSMKISWPRSMNTSWCRSMNNSSGVFHDDRKNLLPEHGTDSNAVTPGTPEWNPGTHPGVQSHTWNFNGVVHENIPPERFFNNARVIWNFQSSETIQVLLFPSLKLTSYLRPVRPGTERRVNSTTCYVHSRQMFLHSATGSSTNISLTMRMPLIR